MLVYVQIDFSIILIKKGDMRMNYKEIYTLYKSTGLNNYILNCLASSNQVEQAFAINTIRKANLKNENDVLLFIAMSI